MTAARTVVAVGSSLFVALAVLAARVGALPGDVPVRDHLLAVASPPLLGFMHVVNTLGVWQVLFPATLVLVVVFPFARRRWWIWVALMIVAPTLEGIFKLVVRRPRPEELSFGFPSGHTNAAAAFFGAVLYLAAPLPPQPRALVRVAAVLMILLVGIARVMLRAHWPSDVLGGMALGLTLASIAAILASRERP